MMLLMVMVVRVGEEGGQANTNAIEARHIQREWHLHKIHKNKYIFFFIILSLSSNSANDYQRDKI